MYTLNENKYKQKVNQNSRKRYQKFKKRKKTAEFLGKKPEIKKFSTVEILTVIF